MFCVVNLENGPFSLGICSLVDGTDGSGYAQYVAATMDRKWYEFLRETIHSIVLLQKTIVCFNDFQN